MLKHLSTGPELPYGIKYSAMAPSPDGNGVILVGGYSLGPFTILGTLLSPELSLGRVHMDGLTLSECHITARNHMRIDFKDLTFYKFKFSPPFLFSNLSG